MISFFFIRWLLIFSIYYPGISSIYVVYYRSSSLHNQDKITPKARSIFRQRIAAAESVKIKYKIIMLAYYFSRVVSWTPYVLITRILLRITSINYCWTDVDEEIKTEANSILFMVEIMRWRFLRNTFKRKIPVALQVVEESRLNSSNSLPRDPIFER